MLTRRQLLAALLMLIGAGAIFWQSLMPSGAVQAPAPGKTVSPHPIQVSPGFAFQDYPVPISTGPFVAPNYRDMAPRHRKFRTALALAALAGPNYAGHFAVVEVGCGTACSIPMALDLTTGAVVDLPPEVSMSPDVIYEYHRNSALLVALTGIDIFTDKPRCKKSFFHWANGSFAKLGETEAPGQCEAA